jgi:hypothetical protein
MNESVCQTDLDCGPGKLCYAGLFAIEGRGCVCSPWYGWGEEEDGGGCNLKTSQWYYSVIIEILLVSCALCVFAVGCYTLSRLGKRDVWFCFSLVSNMFNTTSTLATAAAFSFVAYRVVALKQLFAEPYELDNFTSNGNKMFSPTTVFLERFFVFCTNFCGVLSAFTLALSWIELANRSESLQGWASRRTTSIYKKINLCAMSIFALLNVVLLASNNVPLAALTSMPFLGFIGITFTVGGLKLSKLLKTVSAAIVSEGDRS